jgi:hypothetical protein
MTQKAAPDLSGAEPGERGRLPLLIDCDGCTARGTACADCVVTVLLGEVPGDVTLNHEERRAVEVLSAAGLVPPLRLVHEPYDGRVQSVREVTVEGH